jgi:DNA transformation protein
MTPTKSRQLSSDLRSLRNVGKTIATRLNEVGIFSERDLRKVGAAKAYSMIAAGNSDTRIPVCYYLFSLEGALGDTHWDRIPEERKLALRRSVGAE